MPQRYERTFPVDWREKLLAVLTSEGVTQPAYASRWKLVLADVGKIAGWFLLAAGFIGIVLLIGQVLVYFRFSDDVGALILLPLLLIGWPLLLILVIWPRAQRLARRLRVDIWVGRSPVDALRAAKHPPVLYLRSFSFDNVSSQPSKWLQRVVTLAAGAAAVPTSEMSLVLTAARYAPVLAIGRPHERVSPPGALRFYVRQDQWRAKVESMTPLCQLIIWTTGHTEGLRWEIEHLIETVPPKRLLLWLHVRAGTWKQKQRNLEWVKFVNAYQNSFPRFLPPELRRTRFIGFDDDWTPISIPGRRFPVSIGDWLHFFGTNTFGLRSFLKARMQ